MIGELIVRVATMAALLIALLTIASAEALLLRGLLFPRRPVPVLTRLGLLLALAVLIALISFGPPVLLWQSAGPSDNSNLTPSVLALLAIYGLIGVIAATVLGAVGGLLTWFVTRVIRPGLLARWRWPALRGGLFVWVFALGTLVCCALSFMILMYQTG